MSKFLVDTNVPSELVRPASEVEGWLAERDLDTLFISAVSFGELRKGTILMSPGKRRTELESWIDSDLSLLFSGRILSITRPIAERWGELDAGDKWRVVHNLTLVTRNVKDFDLLGVTIFNPWATE